MEKSVISRATCLLVFQSLLFSVSAKLPLRHDCSSISFIKPSPKSLAEKYEESILDLRGGSGYGSNSGGRGGSYDYDYEYEDRRDGGMQDSYGRRDDYEDDRYGRRDERDRYDDDYYGDGRDYREKDYAPSSRKKSSSLPSIPDVGGILRNGNKKIGLALLGGGMVFTLLGISLFFNKTLMRMGNLLFIAGVPMTIGPGRTTGYFLQPKKSRATICLAFGIFLVLVGWPVFGIALEIFGLLNLFGNMFPVFMIILKQMPIVGTLLNSDNKSKKKPADSYSRQKSSNTYADDGDYYGDEGARGREEDGYSERYY